MTVDAQARPRPRRGLDVRRAEARAGRRNREARLRRALGRRVACRRPVVRRADPRGKRRRCRSPPGSSTSGRRRRQRGRRVLSPHRERLSRPLPARHRRRPPRAHRGVPQALRRAGGVPRRARRCEGADQPPRDRGARAEGAQAGRAAQRGRAPVPDDPRAHRAGARMDRPDSVFGARAQGGADH